MLLPNIKVALLETFFRRVKFFAKLGKCITVLWQNKPL